MVIFYQDTKTWTTINNVNKLFSRILFVSQQNNYHELVKWYDVTINLYAKNKRSFLESPVLHLCE